MDSEDFGLQQWFSPDLAFTTLETGGDTMRPTGRPTPRESDPIPAIAKFIPPTATDTPQTLFAEQSRFIRRSNHSEILIYTDGACLGNGQANPTAGCGFKISPQHKFAFRLENEGPTGISHTQTSNRAELRAIIAALEYRAWYGDGYGRWNRIVIATDSEYVTLGITERIGNWINQGWKTSSGQPVKNRDLWERLIYRIKELHISRGRNTQGVAVSFWRIPRELNAEADGEAKKGAGLEETQRYTLFNGMAV